jgi:A/G-specific adenine glycosylase
MMDLGRIICKPKNPDCKNCPIRLNCIALKNNLIDVIPKKLKKKQIPHYKMVIGIIQKNEKYLICKRNSKGLLGGMWEFPGDKIDLNESNQNALNRILTNYGINIKSNLFIGKAKHIYSHFSIEQYGYQCTYLNGNLKSESHSECKWISKEEEVHFPIHKASHKLLALIKEKYI